MGTVQSKNAPDDHCKWALTETHKHLQASHRVLQPRTQIKILYLVWLGTLLTTNRPSYDSDANVHGSDRLHAAPAVQLSDCQQGPLA